MNEKFGLRIVLVLVLISAIAGIGFYVYRAGVDHCGSWGRHWEGGGSPVIDVWHNRAHEASVGYGETSEDKKE